MRLLKQYYLAIALFSLRIPAIWTVMLIYSLFQVILLYFQGSCSFLPLNVVECARVNPEDVNYIVVNLPKIDNSPKAISEIKESSTMISKGLKTVGNSISKLAPALAGIIISKVALLFIVIFKNIK